MHEPYRKNENDMKEQTHRPATLWSRQELPRSVDAYFSAHRGEFTLSRVKSNYPYVGDPRKHFRELPEINPYEGYHRFEGKGAGCWELVRDNIRNYRTADLLAAGELLLGETSRSGSYGQPGGIGVDQGEVWTGFLDGGVGVEVQVGQDEETNRPEGWQRTTIRGPFAFRCLLELLGFEWIDEKLTGEECWLSHEEVIKEVTERLAASRI